MLPATASAGTGKATVRIHRRGTDESLVRQPYAVDVEGPTVDGLIVPQLEYQVDGRAREGRTAVGRPHPRGRRRRGVEGRLHRAGAQQVGAVAFEIVGLDFEVTDLGGVYEGRQERGLE